MFGHTLPLSTRRRSALPQHNIAIFVTTRLLWPMVFEFYTSA
jgi:hypothetical protein